MAEEKKKNQKSDMLTDDELDELSDDIEEIGGIKTELLAKELFGWIVSELLRGEVPEYAPLVSPQIKGKAKDNFMDFGQWCAASDISKAISICGGIMTRDLFDGYTYRSIKLGLYTELHFVYDLFIENIKAKQEHEAHSEDDEDDMKTIDVHDKEKEDR